MNGDPAGALDREREIFLGALEKTPPGERAAFLDGACGSDAALRARVESLLRHHSEDSFLEEPALAPESGPAAESALSEGIGTVIGRYTLREKIGEGGCGVVYVAEQDQPVRRKVALKVIKLGMDTKQVVARFEAERQALALMDHPNIARIYDAGATETGRPFFVMELVRGTKITDYCDRNQLSTAQRLDLFLQVCRAVQHAHQKGIIHRDLKPSNILVTVNDGVSVPKVIDFGIAKAMPHLQDRLTDKTIYTGLQQFLGTPAYMSPEQAELTSLDMDTRSDIYSLGVLLYELLTGRTPFDHHELLRVGLDAMRQTIRTKEPPRPSARLSTLAAAELSTVALARRSEPPRLIHLVRGDLDWIVMKCLEKDRTRRYETANGLAMDLQRHLNNEPVVARPPSKFYRFQKSVRRNKLLCTAAAVVAVTLVFGIIASTLEAARARRAEQQQARLRSEAEMARHQAEITTLKYIAELRDWGVQIDPLISNRPMYAGGGEWSNAIAYLSKLVESNPTDHLYHHWLTPALVQGGDLEGYRRHCAQVLAIFAGTTNPVIAERMAKDCLILPDSGIDLDAVARLADTAVTRGPGSLDFLYFEFAKGLAEYRLGHFASAIDWMQKVLMHQGVDFRDAQAWLVLGLAQQRSGKLAEARAALAKGNQIIKTNLQESGEMGGDWTDWIIAHALLREARQTIQGDPPRRQ